MEKTPTEINVFRQRIFNMFFDKNGNPKTLEKSKLSNSTYFRLIDGVQPETFDAIKRQLIYDGYLMESEHTLTPTTLGEKFRKSGGFCPTKRQRLNRFIIEKWTDVIAILIAALSLLISIISLALSF